jgi:uncharacterized protein YndB with AHSA1/START domain
MSESGEYGDHGVTIVRIFRAPREELWREWTEPERFGDWYGGAQSEMTGMEMDVREGGTWKGTMIVGSEGGREIAWEGTYRDVAEPKLLVFDVTDEPGNPVRDLCSVALIDIGGGRTEQLFRQRGTMTADQYERAGAGWGTFFDRMEERLRG